MGFARILVIIDITKSLCHGTKVRLDENLLCQQFTYEELPEICYSCGKLVTLTPLCACAEATIVKVKLIYSP